MRKLLNS